MVSYYSPAAKYNALLVRLVIVADLYNFLHLDVSNFVLRATACSS